tara:strand:+ start:98 stop:670 length:573 start_codon:yes stop_codon:yes gene_type:complete
MKLSLLIFTLSSIIFSNSLQKLPENMPFHTKILWGETGIIRKINLAPETRQKELLLRVKMLQLHQKLAMGSLGLFFYQAYIGNQMANGNYAKYHDLHASMSKVVWSSYMTSAALSYFAPPGMKYSDKISSMKVHRILSWLHFAGMASIPFLGYNIHHATDYNKALTLHQNVAAATLVTMSISALLTFLPY